MGRAQPCADCLFGKKMCGKRWGLLFSAFFTRKIFQAADRRDQPLVMCSPVSSRRDQNLFLWLGLNCYGYAGSAPLGSAACDVERVAAVANDLSSEADERIIGVGVHALEGEGYGRERWGGWRESFCEIGVESAVDFRGPVSRRARRGNIRRDEASELEYDYPSVS